MADDGFNASTLSFPSTSDTNLSPLRSIDFRQSVTKVPLSGSTSTEVINKVGVYERVITTTIVGGTTIAIGDTGKLTIAWNDGQTRGTIGTTSGGGVNRVIVSDVGITGNYDGEISTTLEFSVNAT